MMKEAGHKNSKGRQRLGYIFLWILAIIIMMAYFAPDEKNIPKENTPKQEIQGLEKRLVKKCGGQYRYWINYHMDGSVEKGCI